MQISKDANLFRGGLPVESFAVFGGQNMSYELKKLKEGKANILVATPGILLHLLSEFHVVSVAEVKYLLSTKRTTCLIVVSSPKFELLSTNSCHLRRNVSMPCSA
ncbi:putative ATP-dependent RNA helicase ddx3 [Orchesella cincta]|uniref:Putative ATP-dependent RNA helicase ddx3 n=1 Tax=Orchesella cincta TaxID=48709 RepID=A0A1D2NJW3_ORCCI|nr:putative ATP-dependent RNA helicase ddx3 [Orchesella cincta]